MVRFGLGDELIATQSEEEAIASARDAVANGYDVVVAAGGDGSIGLVATELLGTDTALGILPLGSIMNIPRMLDVPRELDGAAGVLRDGHVRRIDVGASDGRIFFEAATVGFHAAIFREMPKVDEGDYGAIVRSMIAAFRYRPSRMTIELEDGREIDTRALVLVVANGRFMGAGFTVAPEALVDDGLFDVRIFRHYSKWERSATSSASRSVAARTRRTWRRNARPASASRAPGRFRCEPTPWTWARPPSASTSARAPCWSWHPHRVRQRPNLPPELAARRRRGAGSRDDR